MKWDVQIARWHKLTDADILEILLLTDGRYKTVWVKKGTGCFSFRSAAGRADATCCRVQTSTPSQLAIPFSRTAFAGSDTTNNIHQLVITHLFI